MPPALGEAGAAAALENRNRPGIRLACVGGADPASASAARLQRLRAREPGHDRGDATGGGGRTRVVDRGQDQRHDARDRYSDHRDDDVALTRGEPAERRIDTAPMALEWHGESG